MKLEPRETWAGNKIVKIPVTSNSSGHYERAQDRGTYTTRQDPVKVQAESADAKINPHEVEAAVQELKEHIKEEVNKIRHVLEGFSACDLAESLKINDTITYRSMLEDAAEWINHTSGLEDLKAKATETLEKAEKKHDDLQKRYNADAKSAAQSKSDTSVKLEKQDPE